MVITCTEYKTMKMLVMSRWECVGESVDHVLKHKEGWQEVAKNIANKEQTDNTKHTITSYLTSYLLEAIIIAHLLFLKGYC